MRGEGRQQASLIRLRLRLALVGLLLGTIVVNYGSLGASYDGIYNGTVGLDTAAQSGDIGVTFDAEQDFIEPVGTALAGLTGNPASPTPLPTAEDCENCLDDDGDGQVDRADSDCAPPIDGANAGLADVTAARALDKCSKAIQKAGAKLAGTRLKLAAGCLKATATCVQTNHADAACLATAAAICANNLGKLVPAKALLDAALVKNCSAPNVASADLLRAAGLGFTGETEPCSRRGTTMLAGVADVSTCVQRQHDCIIDRVIAATVPRAAELFTLAGRDVASEFPCLTASASGDGTGVAETKQKAIRKCDDAIQRAAQRLIGARLKTVQSCSAAVFACLQVTSGDGACLAKSQPKCTKAFGKLPGLDAALTAAIVKSCGTGSLDGADLTADQGLGFGRLAGRCSALGIAGLASPDDVAGCLVRELRCRSLQLLESETPRLVELIGAGGETLGPSPTPTATATPIPTPTQTAPPGFWDASSIPAAKNVMMFKFLNRTNGQYDDAHVFWSVTINNVTQTHSIAEQPLFDMPAHSSGRIYVYLGSVGKTPTNYYDFLEYTIGPTQFNGNTTRVDAFGVKLAMRLHCTDGFEATVGENPATFAEDRSATFQRFVDAVPAEFKQLAQLQAPYRILNPGPGGFDAGGQYANYYASYIDDVWSSNRLTIPKAGPNGSGLGAYPDLSAAIYRHTAGPNTFARNGELLNQSMWSSSSNFYLQDPANYYAEFWHDNAIDGKAYGFPYDDVGGYSSYISHQNPQYMLVAIGW